MKRNSLGGLVAFMVILTGLLVIDDLTSSQQKPIISDNIQLDNNEKSTDLATLDVEEDE
ncbi:MAG: hypothetical protein Wins2KO_18190 [Winogradskyella sp.]